MYATYAFYVNNWHGSMSEQEFNIYGDRASDFLDFCTNKSMIDNLPTDIYDFNKIQKSCCRLADELKKIDDRKSVISTTQNGIVKSMSSGGESISYELDSIDKAIISGESYITTYLYTKVHPYLSGMTDDNGNCYLFWGM